jgi:NTP pyrophosphatase (non-canonical NTP hydrolase)
MMFNELAKEIHHWARGKGFYDREVINGTCPNPSLPAEKLCLIHSEVSEVLDALRDNDKTNEAEEVADILIRVLDYAAWRGIDLEEEVAKKVEKNSSRPQLHGRHF